MQHVKDTHSCWKCSSIRKAILSQASKENLRNDGALWPFELQLLIFSEECKAKMQTPRYDHETYVRNEASIRVGTGITTFSPAEIKLAEEQHRIEKNRAGRMASAIEINRLTNVHSDPANPGGNLPAQSIEIARCNTQTRGEEVVMATPTVAPINTAVSIVLLGPNGYFDYNERQKSACQKHYLAGSQALCNVLMNTLGGNALLLVQNSNGDAVRALTLLNKHHCELSSAYYQETHNKLKGFSLHPSSNPRKPLETLFCAS